MPGITGASMYSRCGPSRVGLGLDRDAITADLDQQMVEIVLVHRAALTRREPQHPHPHLVVLEHDLGADRPELPSRRHASNPKIRPSTGQHREAHVTGVVIVGTGFGCITHLRALRAAGFDVHALVGRDPEKTAERARRFEVPHGLTNLADALALPGVDAVAIATSIL